MTLRPPSGPLAGFLLIAASVLLIVAHGFGDFNVDAITLGLLALAALPYLRELASSFKAGGVEVTFRELTVNDQLFVFVDSLAREHRWTFYKPRRREDEPGPAFKILAAELIRRDRPKLLEQLKSWLRSDDKNLRWFAAEVIGYFKLDELRTTVARARTTRDTAVSLEEWELNCLWAESRCEKPMYESLLGFLKQTPNPVNQSWILESLDQMVEAGEGVVKDFTVAIQDFVRAQDARGGMNAEVAETLRKCRNLSTE